MQINILVTTKDKFILFDHTPTAMRQAERKRLSRYKNNILKQAKGAYPGFKIKIEHTEALYNMCDVSIHPMSENWAKIKEIEQDILKIVSKHRSKLSPIGYAKFPLCKEQVTCKLTLC